jgi:hypothetical protein
LVSEREKVISTNETLVSPDVIFSFVAGLVRRWSQPERKGKELGQSRFGKKSAREEEKKREGKERFGEGREIASEILRRDRVVFERDPE